MTTNTPDQPVVGGAEAAQVRGLLHTHVPISLLMDLTSPSGPPSREILDTEGCPDAWWLAPGRSCPEVPDA